MMSAWGLGEGVLEFILRGSGIFCFVVFLNAGNGW